MFGKISTLDDFDLQPKTKMFLKSHKKYLFYYLPLTLYD